MIEINHTCRKLWLLENQPWNLLGPMPCVLPHRKLIQNHWCVHFMEKSDQAQSLVPVLDNQWNIMCLLFWTAVRINLPKSVDILLGQPVWFCCYSANDKSQCMHHLDFFFHLNIREVEKIKWKMHWFASLFAYSHL